MKRLPAALAFLLLVFVVAALAAGFSSYTCRKMCASHQDAHDWIHSQLDLTPEQKASLELIEKTYHEKRLGFERGMALANRDVAGAIRADGADSERLHEAIGRIHSNMGQLQMLAIGHVFEMKKVLTPEQYKKLLNLTADALDNLDNPHGGE